MHPIRRRHLPTQIEEALARRLLFREHHDEPDELESIEKQMKGFEASKPTVREAMQRLLSTGLVVPGKDHTFVSPPLQESRGVAVLDLEIRCADTPEQRRRAFQSWLECLRHVTQHALRDAMGRRTEDVRVLKNEFERLTYVGYSSYDPYEMASATLNVIWQAAKASENGPILLFANSLMRSLPAIGPWLGAAVQNRQMADDCMKIEEAFRNQDVNKLDDAIEAVFSKLFERVKVAAEHHKPKPMEQGYETQHAA